MYWRKPEDPEKIIRDLSLSVTSVTRRDPVVEQLNLPMHMILSPVLVDLPFRCT
jgi:hypothetical protein